MRNNLFLILVLIFFANPLFAENLNIKSTNISIDKQSKKTIFENNVIATDVNNNVFQTDYAEYDKDNNFLESKGKTHITTSENYTLTGTNIIFDSNRNLITSKEAATIKDLENNSIFLENFEYSTKDNFFRSVGNIKVVDIKNNTYNFSQIYIDEKQREIIGTDIKAFLNDESLKIDSKNKPRIFANTVKINDAQTKYGKSIFTLCNYRKEDKCPPWSLQATEMNHDKNKKTIFYDNAVIKVYDLPIFYFPKLSHPDPSVDRRSGFLPPSFNDSKNLGSSFKIPYFFDINKDKDFTLTSRLFTSEHPLFLGEYRQAHNNSNLILDFGYTKGYKNNNSKKKSGDKSHFFSKFVKNFKNKDESESNIELTLQSLSNDKYLKLYKLDTSLASYETETLENSLKITHENDNYFAGFNANSYETLKDKYNDKYEYILPDIILDKNLFSNNKFGSADVQSNFKIHNYDTNKYTKFLINDLDWNFKKLNFQSGFEGNILGKFKNINYEAKNESKYKKDPTSEFFGAVGYLSKINFYKEGRNNSSHLLTPKALFRYAPDYMKKENDGGRLNALNIFNLDRLNTTDNFEGGLSSTLGFDYNIKTLEREYDFSIGQIINEKENKNMPSSSSLDEKLSDLVGNANVKINENFKINYNFALDQNYQDMNYNEIGGNFNINSIKFDVNYLQEKKHLGNQEYVKSDINIPNGENGVFSFNTKRNLVTNSSEYYDLSYEYLNDCLRAGLFYRREFYNDSELESENSLMFKVTLIPFGNISSPSFGN